MDFISVSIASGPPWLEIDELNLVGMPSNNDSGIFDVVVDIRKRSSTFGHWVGAILSDNNKKQMWVPKGFAHGFVVLSENAEIVYKTTDYYAPDYERCILWNDPKLNIDWGLKREPILPITSFSRPATSSKGSKTPTLSSNVSSGPSRCIKATSNPIPPLPIGAKTET